MQHEMQHSNDTIFWAPGSYPGRLSSLLNGKTNTGYEEHSFSNATCAHGNQLVSSDIPITESGIYLIYACARNNGTPTAGITEVGITIDVGSPIVINACSNEGIATNVAGTIMLPLSSGNNIRHRVFQNGGYAETISNRILRLMKIHDPVT